MRGSRRVLLLCGGYDSCFSAGAKMKVEHHGIKEIFNKIQAAFTLGVVLEIAVPAASLLEPVGVMREVKGWESCIRSDTRHSGNSFNLRIQSAVLVSRAVIITERDEGPDFEGDFFGQGGNAPLDLVLNNCRVLTLHNKDGLLDFQAFHL